MTGTRGSLKWVTQQDVDLARRVTEIAAEQSVDADPASITTIEIALDIGPRRDDRPGVGGPADRELAGARGRGTIGDDVEDARRSRATPRLSAHSCLNPVQVCVPGAGGLGCAATPARSDSVITWAAPGYGDPRSTARRFG
ncbi:MAG: hypothetical protein WKF47_11700 [Geodermatophilaceae bacterium]